MTGTLAATETGEGDRALVMLHGFGSCRHVWAALQSDLSALRTIAYDLPGHGGSLDWPEAGPAKVAVRAVLADLQGRGLDRVHFVGHSMGGAIATLCALAEPARVASLTLLAPGGFGEEINGRLLSRYATAGDDVALRHCLEEMTGWQTPVEETTLRPLALMRSVAGQMPKLAEIAKAIARDGRQGRIPREKLESLTMPVAVLWGTGDNVLPFQQTADLPPMFGLHRVAGAGHMLIEEAPDLVSAIVRQMVS